MHPNIQNVTDIFMNNSASKILNQRVNMAKIQYTVIKASQTNSKFFIMSLH